MPSFRFTGFQTGTAVSLSATQGSNSDSATVANWGEAVSTPITAALSAIRTSGTAPMGTILYAETASPAARVDIPFHDIENVWSFDDPGTFDALGNNPIWGSNKDIAYGPRATHVFSTAKPQSEPYQVVCVSHDGENAPNSETIDITVNDPNTVFAGADTAVVSAASDFSGAPAGAAQFTSVSAARSHLSGRANARLLLRAGETFGEINISETGSGTGRRYYVGRFGSGARPIISLATSGDGVRFNTGGANSSSFEELIVDGLDIRGSYDATASNPVNTSAVGINFTGAGRLIHKTVWDCRISGMARGVLVFGPTQFTTPARNFYMGNTVITNWLDYGVFCDDAGDFGLSGCRVQQPTGTINGSGKGSSPFHPDHGPFRISRAWGTTVFTCCDFASFNDWSSLSSGNSSRSFQPIIRWNTGNGGTDPELVVDRFRGEGGAFRLFNGVSVDGGSGGSSTRNPAWVVADRVHHILTDHSPESPNIPLGGTTVRNCTFVVPDTPAGWSVGFSQFVETGGTGPQGAGNQDRRVEAYSNAFIDLRRDAYAGARPEVSFYSSNTNRPFNAGGLGSFTNKYLGNNVHYAPNMVDGAPADEATNLDTAGRYTVLYDGERYESASVDTNRAYGSEVTASYAPLSGSNAIGAASGKVSILDMNGDLRSAVLDGLSRSAPSIGPYEPNLNA